MVYPNLKSAIRPVPHLAGVPVPSAPSEIVLSTSSDSDNACDQDMELYEPEQEDSTPKPFAQLDLNHLVRDLGLTKLHSELLASRLNERNLLAPDICITKFCKRSDQLHEKFEMNGSLCYCNGIPGLFEELDLTYNPSEWRLFTDASVYSTKAMLLHIGNKLPSIHLAQSVVLKATSKFFSFIFEYIKYNAHKWLICANLKVVAILNGRQGGYTKFMCFLCQWDSRAREEHYIYVVNGRCGMKQE